ncbi:CheR family methyltransferase [Psychrobacter frigidicola]|uniref:CheR family methyltransferase n=1 Tax=Psychrobacter frigidicola TaxID=45611 RepID=UPI001D10D3CE|nr:CheR family methyltransferase [Psychrobacter frigidicola]
MNNSIQTHPVLCPSSTNDKVHQPLKTLKPSAWLSVSNAPQWRHFVEQEIGFVLPDEQLQWLLNAVDNTARVKGLSLDELWTAVQINSVIRQRLIDTVLISESRFFRHLPSIEFVAELAELTNQQPTPLSTHVDKDTATPFTPFNIWSVGCSTGQEVWSLVMSLAAKQLNDFTVLGTDVSAQGLAQARAGQYGFRQCRPIPQSCQQFIKPITGTDNLINSSLHTVSESTWQVDLALRQYVNFAWHNIFTQEMPTLDLQQVIICQNVLIYFRQFDQRDILARLAAQCAVGGHIILAPGEAFWWRPHNMRRINHSKVNVWQKISA